MKMTEALKGGAAAIALATTAACATAPAEKPAEVVAEAAPALPEITVSDAELEGNPFRAEWTTPYGLPPFDAITDAHFKPAILKGMLESRAEIEAIVSNPDEPTFENTILALEVSGEALNKVLNVFGNLSNTDTNDTIQALEAEIYPMLTRERNAVTFNPVLFARVKSVYDRKDSLGLDEQDARLVELTHRGFVRAGAGLSPDVQAEVGDINEQLSTLTTQFGQNLLAATKAFKYEVTDESRLAGLSPDLKAALKVPGEDRWLIGVDRAVFEDVMKSAEDRELRRALFDGYRLRATSGETDNGSLAIKIAQLRARKAELMGYKSHAHYVLENRMAKTPDAAMDFLAQVLAPGLKRANEEVADMQALAGDTLTISGEDYWYYSEKVRAQKYAFDEASLRPYLEAGAVRSGTFAVASKLFGIDFTPVEVPVWNPTVQAWDVTDKEAGASLGLFMADNYARASKQGGAWMSAYREESNVGGKSIRPLITNNLNLTQPQPGEPALISFSEAETMFHEFGHALHGLLTNVRYASYSGTYGGPDYSEFPSQVLEHWAIEPEVLAIYARHYETGEPIPQDLVDKMNNAATFNQGFATTEFIAASLIDLSWHMLSSEEAAAITDARAFELDVLKKYNIPEVIEPRYRSHYFSHIFAGGYSAGYYAYLWANILDSDGFAAFKATGDIFDPALAADLKKWVFQSGGLRETDELYRNFRGSDPTIEPLLRDRGFAEAAPN
ncbi:M3 family metallopeptidase [Hyphomonas sp.]|uniref:M3 family metallopeptidase n=1 Tax=Hyphomonas sp. TaxID=87 RepID=UPI0025B9D5F5|nr:M3 family metallopeptidase [Hyphomonas sp.]